MDFLNDDAHTIITRMCARLNNKEASPISIIDAFAINIMCVCVCAPATQTMASTMHSTFIVIVFESQN